MVHTETKMAGSKRPKMNRPPSSEPDMTTAMGQWGAYFAHLMDKSGVSAEELAAAIQKDRSTIFLYRKGESVPPLKFWDAIAKKLGKSSWRDLVPPASFLKS